MTASEIETRKSKLETGKSEVETRNSKLETGSSVIIEEQSAIDNRQSAISEEPHRQSTIVNRQCLPLLLEVGCEEIPARFLRDAEKGLGERVQAVLRQARLLLPTDASPEPA